MSNAVIRTIKRTIGKCSKNYLEGKITWASAKPHLEERGGVYGIAIKLDKSEVESFFGDYCDDRKKDLKFKDWKTIGNNYYPLYWGKDINLGFRLFEHMKSSKSTWTIQLDKKTYLIGKDLIYGAVLCSKPKENEKLLREKYPDIYKTKILSFPKAVNLT